MHEPIHPPKNTVDTSSNTHLDWTLFIRQRSSIILFSTGYSVLRLKKALLTLLVRRNVDGNESNGMMVRNLPGVIFGRLDNCVFW